MAGKSYKGQMISVHHGDGHIMEIMHKCKRSLISAALHFRSDSEKSRRIRSYAVNHLKAPYFVVDGKSIKRY